MKKKLYNFKDYLASTNGYTYFNDYYVDKMIALEDRYNMLENNSTSPNLHLIQKKNSKILSIFKFIRSIFIKKELEKE